MPQTRPTLARTLTRTPHEHAQDAYDEARQMSVRSDGTAAVTVGGLVLETAASFDSDEPVETKAARDPDDLLDSPVSGLDATTVSTNASADSGIETFAERDPDDPIETRATRDPDDAGARGLGLLLTEAARDPDDDEADPDPESPDDLVTGVVHF